MLRNKAQKLWFALKNATKAKPADAILLSGGLDSSVLAALDPTIPGITVVLEGRGVDLKYAQQVATHVGLPAWYPIEISKEQAMNDLPEIMRLNNTYDIGIKSDIPVYEGMKFAATKGFRRIRTGDASDELFAGYSWLHTMTNDQMKEWMKGAIPQIKLPSSAMGRAMNISMHYPYLDQEVWKLALEFDPSDNITELDTDKLGDFSQQFDPNLRNSKKWGKVLLRKAAETILPEEIAWRTKTPLEYGSGFYELEEILEESVTAKDMERLQESGNHFWNKAHGKLYLMFTDAGLTPKKPLTDEYGCSWCGNGVIQGRHHCATCGAYPSSTQPKGVFEKTYS
jgi:asparagine synthase (glutamine-hydrolysing)